MRNSNLSALSKFSDRLKQKKESNIRSRLSDSLNTKVINKRKLTIDEQVEYMKAKGISFDALGEDDAIEYLKENSYYYKVTAYRKNFLQNNDGLYQNLDFVHLKDLSIIDMHLRYLVIKLSLDLEHSLKNLIVQLITDKNNKEDGYKIVEDYDKYEKARFKRAKPEEEYFSIRDKIFKKTNVRNYNYDLINKSKNQLSVWKLIELMSYGQLSTFIGFYVSTKKHKSNRLKIANEFLYYSKNIRDSAAHNRPIILNITEKNQLGGKKAKIRLKNYIINSGVDKQIASSLLSNYKIHDLCSLIYLHDSYIKGKYMRISRKKEMINLYRRAIYRKNIYESQNDFIEISNLFFMLLKRY